MLNETFVLQRIEPLLNAKRELSEFEFIELFSSGKYPLTLREQYEVINIMIANDIDFVEEKEEEVEIFKQSKIVQTTDTLLNIKHLLKLKNEQLCIMAQKNDKAALAAIIEKNKRFVIQKV